MNIARYEYVNQNMQNPWPLSFDQPEYYPVCGILADNWTASWHRDPDSMPTPDFPATEGSQYRGRFTNAGYEAENSGYPNPYIEGWYSDQMFREIDRVEALFQYTEFERMLLHTSDRQGVCVVLGSRQKCLATLETRTILLRGCLTGTTRLRFENTRPVYCFSNSAGICYPAPGRYGQGQNGFGVPAGVTGISIATTQGPGLSVSPDGPTAGFYQFAPTNFSCDPITIL